MKKTNIRRFVSAACAALVMVAGLCSPVSKCMNVQETTSYALTDSGYVKYYCMEQFIGANYGGKTGLTVSDLTRVNFFNCGNASRKYLPNEMNCTLISLLNLYDYYRYKYLEQKNTQMTNTVLYFKLVSLATLKYGYSSTGGLNVFKQADLCEAFFKEQGFPLCSANQSLYFPKINSEIQTDLTRSEPYLISSSAENHSVLITGYSKFKVTYKNSLGNKVSKTIVLLNVFDPNGDSYVVDSNNISSCYTDVEMILYVNPLSVIIR